MIHIVDPTTTLVPLIYATWPHPAFLDATKQQDSSKKVGQSQLSRREQSTLGCVTQCACDNPTGVRPTIPIYRSRAYHNINLVR